MLPTKIRCVQCRSFAAREFIAVLFLAFVSFLAGAQASRGQQAPPGAIGRVEGNDVSVDNGTTARQFAHVCDAGIAKLRIQWQRVDRA